MSRGHRGFELDRHSIETRSIFRVETADLSFNLVESTIESAFKKSFDLSNLATELRSAESTVVIKAEGTICGVAAIEFESWNRRAILRHRYVSRQFRGAGAGLTLLNKMLDDARGLNARCLWVETQNTNYPAIQFYRRCGFKFCGFDQSLYESQENQLEVALDFVRELEPSPPEIFAVEKAIPSRAGSELQFVLRVRRARRRTSEDGESIVARVPRP